MTGDQAHGHGHDGPAGGIGWVVLDAVVTGCAVAIMCILADWWFRGRDQARQMDALAAYVERERAARGQAAPDPNPADGTGA